MVAPLVGCGQRASRRDGGRQESLELNKGRTDCMYCYGYSHQVKVYTPFPEPGIPATEFQDVVHVNMDASVLFARLSFIVPLIPYSSRSTSYIMNWLRYNGTSALTTCSLRNHWAVSMCRMRPYSAFHLFTSTLMPWIGWSLRKPGDRASSVHLVHRAWHFLPASKHRGYVDLYTVYANYR